MLIKTRHRTHTYLTAIFSNTMAKFRTIRTFEKHQSHLLAKGLFSSKLIKSSHYLDFFKRKKSFVGKRAIKIVDTSKFNAEQQNVMSLIDSHIRRGSKPLRLLMCGNPGTGKTYTILGIQQLLRKYKQKFVACCYTGAASAHINGTTLHNALGLNYGYKNNPPWANIYTARKKLRGLRWLIVDEISLIGLKMLKFISERLSAILCDSRPFANLNVILLGDWGQLPCLFDLYCFVDVNRLTKPEDIAASKLYHSFDKACVLRTQMRQRDKEEEEFRELLERMRKGAITQNDVDLLNTRVISNLPKEEAERETLWLFADNASKNVYNEFRLKNQPNMIFEIPSIDSPGTPIELNHKLRLAVGVPVMLTKNINLDFSLFNGQTGVVTDLIRDEKGEFVAIMVKFPNYSGPNFCLDGSVPITRVEFFEQDSLSGYEYKSLRFPLDLYYSSSIHKAQGSTLDKVTIALVEPECKNSLFYKLGPAISLVGCSRVKRLKDLQFNRPFDINLVNRKETNQVRDRILEEERLLNLQTNTFD